MNCFCEWDDGVCGANYEITQDGVSVGKCSYSDSSENNCDDGLLIYSWVANWNWGHDGFLVLSEPPSENEADYKFVDGKYYYDPDKREEKCVDGDTLIECASFVALPFFGWLQVILVGGILGGVYYFRKEIRRYLKSFH